ncbi:hypothetical protein RI129_005054 [Pyrocoelia pectoralis]|uniref:Uncharacterized protein n=1 Tax=Pyrocoelia pectoralis TaxID=417401 RepID=A0AAN7VE35_9COLE
MKMVQLLKKVERRHHSTMKVLFFIFLMVLANSQAKPQYRENLGQYVPDNSGQYVHDDSGRYIPDHSGDYIADGLGGYAHDGTGGYKSDGSGNYNGEDFSKFQRRSDFGSYNSGSRNFANSFTDKTSYKAEESKYNKISSANLLGAGSTVSRQTVKPTNLISSDDRAYGNLASAASPIGAASKLSGSTYDRYPNSNGKWKILRQGENIDTDGYHWEYETENKIIAEESGKLANKGTDKEAMRAKGFYQYMGPDNVPYSVTYTADENGFVPVGSHLPTPPPIPVEILKALDYLRSLGKL